MLRLSQSQNLLDFLLHSALGVVAIITISIVLGMLLTFEEKLLTYLTIKQIVYYVKNTTTLLLCS